MVKYYFRVQVISEQEVFRIIRETDCDKIATLSSLYELGRLAGKKVESLEEIETDLGVAHKVCDGDVTMQVLEKYLTPVS